MSDPPSDTNPDDRQLLINAYVDGEATVNERAQVEADPALLAEADELRAVKAAVGDVPAMSDDARQRFLEAALTEFRNLRSNEGAPSESALPPPQPLEPTSLDAARAARSAPPPPARGRGTNRWLAIAAAVVLVVAGGAVAVVMSDSGGDDSADMSTAGATAPDERSQDEADGGMADAADDPGGPSRGPNAAAPQDHGSESSDDSEDEIDDTMSGDEAPGAAHDETDELPAIDTRQDLVDWYQRLERGGAPGRRAGEEVCGLTIVGMVTVDGDRVAVIRRGDRLVALDAATCALVLTADVP